MESSVFYDYFNITPKYKGCTRARKYNISVIIVSLLQIFENFSLVLVFSVNLHNYYCLVFKFLIILKLRRQKANRLFEKLELHVEEEGSQT